MCHYGSTRPLDAKHAPSGRPLAVTNDLPEISTSEPIATVSTYNGVRGSLSTAPVEVG